ncbi:MAG: sigma 54-interacting transcriptional regulator, partial [Pyrinomonadaceae bacterium]|nr:sigma 54-interacting transcriptional regulator [Pyrinomonadaceae bacterium]
TLSAQGKFDESLKTLHSIKDEDAFGDIDAELRIAFDLQKAVSLNGTGDADKAEAHLKETLRSVLDSNSDQLLGNVYVAFADVYHGQKDYKASFSYAEKGLDASRDLGDWRGMVRAYYKMARARLDEGDHKSSFDYFELATKIAKEGSAPILMGKVYSGMSLAHLALSQPKDGAFCGEKAVGLLSKTEDRSQETIAKANLAANLLILGDWAKAEELLMESRDFAAKTSHEYLPKIYNSLGELKCLQGNLDEAQDYLEKGIESAEKIDDELSQIQNAITLSRCFVAKGSISEAIEEAEEIIKCCKIIDDQHLETLARIVLAEAYLTNGDLEKAKHELNTLDTASLKNSFGVTGNTQRLMGLVAAAENDQKKAIHSFRRGLTIFETREDIYHSALMHYLLGETIAETDIERALKHLISASQVFRNLGVTGLHESAEEKIVNLENVGEDDQQDEAADTRDRSANSQLLMQRLAEATASRELLFRELVAILHQESEARKIIIADSDDSKKYFPFITHGFTTVESNQITAKLQEAVANDDLKKFAKVKNVKVYPLRSPSARPAMLIIYPAFSAGLNNGGDIKPLLRIVELGMDVCALRDQDNSGVAAEETKSAFTSQSLMPGFIHSSQAMTALVEEVYKIRSSDVTVLITGESGTGKELVSRAIHTVSTRKDKVFVPFNCTAVPRELAEGHLFGYKRGAFTGAANDSPGMVRSADGGTLLLDEVGDLPIDIQPKLLRFLQEGEVHPLGGKKPVKVDVRVIAATNMDLEQRVKDGLFREDLFYRLNVIRLRVPPLRERRSEIKPIVKYYINHYSSRFNKENITIKPQTIDLLMVCDWEGNVRQLCNEIQRIVARAEDGEVITPNHISPELKANISPPNYKDDSNVKPIM